MLNLKDPATLDLFESFAQKYIWWKCPEEALLHANCIVLQVMDIADDDDVLKVCEIFAEDVLRDVLKNAHAGEFSRCLVVFGTIGFGPCDVKSAMAPLPKR